MTRRVTKLRRHRNQAADWCKHTVSRNLRAEKCPFNSAYLINPFAEQRGFMPIHSHQPWLR